MKDTYYLPTVPCEVQGYISTYCLNLNRYLGYSVMASQIRGTQLKPSQDGASGARVTWSVGSGGYVLGRGVFLGTYCISGACPINCPYCPFIA